MPEAFRRAAAAPCKVAVIWIDWYAYHVARFSGILAVPSFERAVRGVELVGGVGVHRGLKFREDRQAGLPVDTLMPDSGWQEAGQFALARALWSYLNRLRPEVVLVPGYYTLPAIAAAVWAKVNRRTGVLMTESTAADHARTWWKETAKSMLIRGLFDWAICGGKAHRRYLEQLGFAADRVAGCYDVVDNEYFEHATDALRCEPSRRMELPERYFLYVGRLAPEKNVDGLIVEWNAYRAAGGTWALVVVGAGPLEAALRTLAAASPFAAEIHFAGHASYTQLPRLYAFAGCFVLPSTREPWGLVVNEAMASGLPVIVSERCGCAEDLVVEGETGFCFNPAISGRLAETMGGIASLTHDELIKMGNNSIRYVRNYSKETFGKQVEKITLNRSIFTRQTG